MSVHFIVIAVFTVAILMLVGCASQRPVLYPNAQLKAVGEQAAEQEINDCLQLANDSGIDEKKGKKIAKQTAGGAAIGAAASGAWGLVRGDAASMAAAGAAAGGASGLVGGALQSGSPDPVYRNFVQRCLRERGYEVIGWQ